MPAPDDVQLTDLEVVQRYSLALRVGTAPREDVVAALEADLAWLTGGRAARRAATADAPPARRAARRASGPAEPAAADGPDVEPARPVRRPRSTDAAAPRRSSRRTTPGP